jgi:flagella basal body P-ring formation protein FlgA
MRAMNCFGRSPASAGGGSAMHALRRIVNNLSLIGIAAAIPCSPAFAHEAVSLTFHDSVTVPDTVIRLSDIAEMSGDLDSLKEILAGTVVGESAPPGYSRCIQAADLLLFRLKPLFKDIDFKCNNNIRVKVATLGILKRAGDFESNLMEYLSRESGWKIGQVTATIKNADESFHVYEGPLEVSVDGLHDPYPRGLKALQLLVTQFGRVTRVPLECKIAVAAPVVVAVKELPREKVLGVGDLELRRMDLTDLPGTPFFSVREAVGKRASQVIAASGIVTDRLIEEVPLVQKGDPISIEVVRGDTRVSVAAVARENGSEGQKIWVENSMTHRLVRVTVKGAGYGLLL